ncbi:N-succinylarginine dihydrolase [Derxia gummosa]|uniref:N-succinylarginine dihydrolase n=1 Tax=Derxia gummosa DSM 723 TaxID=1121388 RepID=A0A8B6X7P5_9BURK|nr:N-succinylarginine dihydrolase [Derxia gummosa]
MPTREFNFDGLVGPTHNFAGLSHGNVASQAHRAAPSNPRAAALQGLAKMRALADRGHAQAVLPPHPRPDWGLLRAVGFDGRDAEALDHAARAAPALYAAAWSAAAMWTANAATVSPSADCADGRVHFTPANLNEKLHRAGEHRFTARVLRRVFGATNHFAVHDALPGSPALGDEGAANHSRFCADHGAPGVELFVYGKRAFAPDAPAPKRFPARQSDEAGRAIARLHRLAPGRVVHAQQHPAAIDAGVFHNDVIALAHRDVLLSHEMAFLDEGGTLGALRAALDPLPLRHLRVSQHDVPLADAVASYLFNSQLLDRDDGRFTLVVPAECRRIASVARWLDARLDEGEVIADLLVADLGESMRNGGGPACLRLRVVLTAEQAAAVHPGVLFTPALHDRLADWVKRHYRDRLAAEDLRDPALAGEVARALAELEAVLDLPGLYSGFGG